MLTILPIIVFRLLTGGALSFRGPRLLAPRCHDTQRCCFSG
jgi:hypothetical protein